MLRVAPAADAVRALFVGRRYMGATILRWLTIIVHLIGKKLVICGGASALAFGADSARSRARRGLPELRFRGVRSGQLRKLRRKLSRFAAARTAGPFRPDWKRVSPVCAELSEPFAQGSEDARPPPPGFPGGAWGWARAAGCEPLVAVGRSPRAAPSRESPIRTFLPESGADWARKPF